MSKSVASMDMHPRLAAVRFHAVPNLSEPQFNDPEMSLWFREADAVEYFEGVERTDA
jgi:hypothetical protein